MPPAKKATSKRTREAREEGDVQANCSRACSGQEDREEGFGEEGFGEAFGAAPMSAAHKRALAEGRQSAAVVDRYLAALHVPKRRGRQVSLATLQQRLATVEVDIKKTAGTARLFAAQQARDLRTRIAALANTATTDIKKLEADFVKVAKTFSERRGISYGAWRDAGVPAQVLKRAKVPRTRG